MQTLVADLNGLCKEIDSKCRYLATAPRGDNGNWESNQGAEEALNEIKRKLEQIIVKHFVYDPLFAQLDKSVLKREIRASIRNTIRRNGVCVEQLSETVTKKE